MKTVIITDAKYRSSISAARTFGRAGWRVVLTQTRDDTSCDPPAFSSRYAAETRWIDGRADFDAYAPRLLEVIKEYDRRPVLFPIGAATLNAVSRQRDGFSQYCDFLISPPEVLDALNDKEAVHLRALELGLPVPKEYDGAPDNWPVIIKPHCGEKFGLKAGDRYAVANEKREFMIMLGRMKQYDRSPIVQEVVGGDGYGASLLLGKNSELLGAFCHRRIREYPIDGGPSSCCESIYDEEKIDAAYRLLSSFGFCGLAMVEFKGDKILEVNPRIWGSFPLTVVAGSPLALRYAEEASGETISYEPRDYNTGVRMRFLLNDTLAVFSLLGRWKIKRAFSGIADIFRAREAFSDRDDPVPRRAYLKSTILRR